VLLLELVRGHAAQAAVGLHGVVVAPPALNDRKHLDHALGADRASHVDGQALAGEFVDDGQALDLLAFGSGIEEEVVGPVR